MNKEVYIGQTWNRTKNAPGYVPKKIKIDKIFNNVVFARSIKTEEVHIFIFWELAAYYRSPIWEILEASALPQYERKDKAILNRNPVIPP